MHEIEPGEDYNRGEAAANDQSFPAKNRIQGNYPFVQLKL
jgi:hypothetical protein